MSEFNKQCEALNLKNELLNLSLKISRMIDAAANSIDSDGYDVINKLANDISDAVEDIKEGIYINELKKENLKRRSGSVT